MREVIVTVGTRASGKSSFCEKVVALDTSIVVVSRDKILIELFGSTSLDPYTGGHYYAYEKMWEAVEKQFEAPELKMILDVWNGNSRERRLIIKKLHELGADRVIAWFFVTPVEVVEEWFWKKPGIIKFSERKSHEGKKGLVLYSDDAPRRDHELFHELAADIESDGFDEIIRINPVITKPIDILDSQANLKL